LGLAGECSEMVEKCYAQADTAEIAKEAGDVLWYCANVLQELGIGDFKEVDTTDAINSAVPEVTLLVELVVASGQTAEIIKKTMRDNGGQITDINKVKVEVNVNKIVELIGHIINRKGLHLLEVMTTNIDKLQSRKNRGVITGSGDNR